MRIVDYIKAACVVAFVIFVFLGRKTHYEYYKSYASNASLAPLDLCKKTQLSEKNRIYTAGFAPWEGSFSWTNAAASYIFFKLPESTPYKRAYVFVKPYSVLSRFAILRMRGVRSSTVKISHGATPTQKIEISSPQSMAGKLVSLDFKIVGARRGSVIDKRWLGINISNIKVCVSEP